MPDNLQIITDGSCLGNPGPGGWACIIRWDGGERELTGSEVQTTNNRMELTAAIRGLESVHEPAVVEVVTDSQYVLRGITEYISRWKQNGWRTSAGAPIANQDLWLRLDELVRSHTVRWTWIKGHANHADQNRCDGLALAAARLRKYHAGSPSVAECSSKQ